MANPRVLKFDLEAMEKCVTELKTAVGELETIQKNLQKAMDDMTSAGGWVSTGSKEFESKYNTSWIEGITDRKGVMNRMIEHLEEAQRQYRPIQDEAEQLSLETD